MRASVALGGKSRSQHSQFGRSSNTTVSSGNIPIDVSIRLMRPPGSEPLDMSEIEMWLLKNSLTGKWSKKVCNRKPYKRRSQFSRHFVSLQVWLFGRTMEFFNSHEMFQQLRIRSSTLCWYPPKH